MPKNVPTSAVLRSKSLAPAMDRFVAGIHRRLKRYGYKLILRKAPYVFDCGMPCSGYTDDENKMIAVATGKPANAWVSVLAHEASHADQSVEQCASWRVLEAEPLSPHVLLDEWLMGNIQLKKKNAKDMIGMIQNNELDCEKRAVRKMMHAGLDVDFPYLIQQANSYIYFYTMCFRRRAWYPVGASPYSFKELYSAMPTKFLGLNDYWEIPRRYVKLYDRLVFN